MHPAAHAAPAPAPPPPLEAVLEFLRSGPASGAGAAQAGPTQVIETHMSWVFLAGEHVLKLKKPARHPFLDFSTLAAREFYCREEVRLNARLAPGVYLGVLALQWDGRGFALQPDGAAAHGAQTVDWLVHMRRLPDACLLDRTIASQRLRRRDIDALTAVLVAFYRSAAVIDIDPSDYAARFEHDLSLGRDMLLRPRFALRGAAPALERFGQALRRCHGALRERAVRGRIVDGHGDLRPEHVGLLEPPVVIDCLEFNAALRQVDPFDEVAYLGLECRLAGAAWVGPQLAAGCAEALGDAPPAALMHLYSASRGLLRARLAIAHLLDAEPRTPQKWAPLAERCIEQARASLDALERGEGFSAATSHGSP